MESQQLVLDVPEGSRVVLSRKEKGARSQLWRMTGDGQLQHEGSSPPRDPRSKHSSHSDDRILVSTQNRDIIIFSEYSIRIN